MQIHNSMSVSQPSTPEGSAVFVTDFYGNDLSVFYIGAGQETAETTHSVVIDHFNLEAFEKELSSSDEETFSYTASSADEGYSTSGLDSDDDLVSFEDSDEEICADIPVEVTEEEVLMHQQALIQRNADLRSQRQELRHELTIAKKQESRLSKKLKSKDKKFSEQSTVWSQTGLISPPSSFFTRSFQLKYEQPFGPFSGFAPACIQRQNDIHLIFAHYRIANQNVMKLLKDVTDLSNVIFKLPEQRRLQDLDVVRQHLIRSKQKEAVGL
jgi:hypothetical protein